MNTYILLQHFEHKNDVTIIINPPRAMWGGGGVASTRPNRFFQFFSEIGRAFFAN